jgi:hypothetical protein
MSSEFVAIIGTLVGAVVAGVISYIAGRGMKTHEWRLALAREEIALRKSLYVAFLAEAQRLIIQSTDTKISSVAELNDLSAKYAEISLLASEPVIKCAKLVMEAVLLAHTAGKEHKDTDFNRKKQSLIDAVRKELASYTEN